MNKSRYSNHDFLFVRISLCAISPGIDLKNVKELINYREITILPGTPTFLEGSMRVRNLSVPVIDLRKRFSLGQEVGPLTRIIIATVDGSIAGFVVDRVKDITSGVKEALLKSDKRYPWNECVDSSI